MKRRDLVKEIEKLGCVNSHYKIYKTVLDISMFDIKWIQDRINDGEYYFSKHGDQERQNNNLTILEIEEALLNGKVLEQYDDTGRGESCLVVGFSNFGKPVHNSLWENGCSFSYRNRI